MTINARKTKTLNEEIFSRLLIGELHRTAVIFTILGNEYYFDSMHHANEPRKVHQPQTPPAGHPLFGQDQQRELMVCGKRVAILRSIFVALQNVALKAAPVKHIPMVGSLSMTTVASLWRLGLVEYTGMVVTSETVSLINQRGAYRIHVKKPSVLSTNAQWNSGLKDFDS